ncbi:hypothetical protein JTB14_031914 [Gonioctena quinquepunctata]|nr:hypothetical protein JTB14_031914 [Gonioctena quinquepunctata]
MDLITQTSLEALLLKATNSKNLNFDTAAVEAFCTLINKEKDGAHIGVKVIAARLTADEEKEVLQTLNILDTCMSKCGTHFQNEVGKFRFLNEMIKLVSPKYLGSQTPLTVKQKVLQLLYLWTLDYPKETKIKEAFDMLRKQGVVREIPNPNMPTFDTLNVSKRKTNSVFHDEEKSKILQKLLQSKDPEDVQAANWLIKSMVKEDDKRAELKSRRISELESVQNNVRLLNEMLDSYKPGTSSTGELDLIKELYQNCERLRPTINKLILETNHGDGILGDVLGTNDELSTAFTKYNILVVQGKTLPTKSSNVNPLLHFEVDSQAIDHICKDEPSQTSGTSVDVLCDIFNAASIPDSGEVLQPITLSKCDDKNVRDEMGKNNKIKALEDLDVLGEHLRMENLQGSRPNNFRNTHEKIPMNLLSKISEQKQNQASQPKNVEPYDLDLNYLLQSRSLATDSTTDDAKSLHDTSDDFLVDISDENMLEVDKTSESDSFHTSLDADNKENGNTSENGVVSKRSIAIEKGAKCDIKLNDVFVKLEDIEPSSFPPLTILDEKNGISVTLHLAKDKPKHGVSVFVITTVSKNKLPLSSYLFQAVVPKGCKLKMLPPSSTDLPTYNPFLPPSAITQIMLIANPDGIHISLKFIISYIMDEDTVTEMGEVDNLPML